MDLDQFKEMWSEVGHHEQGPSAEELQALLQKKSKSPIAKMKRNLLIELIFVLVLYVSTVYYYFAHFTGGMLGLAWMLMLIGVFYLLYYYQKRKLLNKMECVSCEVKSNLSMQLITLEKYVRFYMWSGVVMFPVVFIFSCLVVFFYSPEVSTNPQIKEKAFVAVFVAVIIVFAAVLTIPMYFINKWYVRKLYGQYVDQLKLIVQEMSESF